MFMRAYASIRSEKPRMSGQSCHKANFANTGGARLLHDSFRNASKSAERAGNCKIGLRAR